MHGVSRRCWPQWAVGATLGLFGASSHAAISGYIPSSPASVKAVAAQVAYDMMTQYQGNQSGQIPGLLPYTDPEGARYYWWECGAMFGSLIDYWFYTGDSTYNKEVTQGMLFQVGANQNYEPVNQTLDLGNDDQAFWGFAALSAAENKFPNPPPDQPQWLALAQAVFNSQAYVWDMTTCHGGLHWQITTTNQGYNYKNSIANGCFFQLAARLGKYTLNHTYLDWANKAWNWSEGVGLFNQNFNVIDGVMVPGNCTTKEPYLWTYNTGVFMYGAACMWNVTGLPIWKQRTQQLLNAAQIFFHGGTIMEEIECEPRLICNGDQKSYKAYLSRWMGQTAKVASWTYPQIQPLLLSSSVAAVKTCSGGPSGSFCGLQWYTETFDGNWGVGQQMSVLEVVQAQLIGLEGYVTLETTGPGRGKGEHNREHNREHKGDADAGAPQGQGTQSQSQSQSQSSLPSKQPSKQPAHAAPPPFDAQSVSAPDEQLPPWPPRAAAAAALGVLLPVLWFVL